jgi:hypothetical protein
MGHLDLLGVVLILLVHFLVWPQLVQELHGPGLGLVLGFDL